MSANTHPYQSTILDKLPAQLIANCLSNGSFVLKSFHKNEVVHFEGEACEQIEIILSGEIVIERIGISGDLMTVSYFHKGQIIGANLIFSSTEHYPMTITSRKPTKVLSIGKSLLLKLCQDYPDFMMAYIKIISDLSVLIGLKMKNRVSRTIRQSIITYLARQSKLQDTTTIRLTLSKKALAEMFGVSRTSLSRELQKMRLEGLIDFDSKSITLLAKELIQD
ncbi:Crp/Fnr family transcriptional regulator [Eubacteriaceae bacterium ES2]|nr:Crp/Fnr family transcriptional regulator [Eubacteriaceae bacterium ES2]WKY46333.1 Crp/Fnr family transcriptional regulator [Eubacteriaceae bacterium ES3]